MENNNYQFIPVESEEKDGITFNFSDFVRKCVKNWYWFAISLFVCVCLAGVYILRTRPVYQSYATVLIKEASARRMATSDIESVINFSGGSMSSKVVNEVIAFKSPALMAKVVERLDLNTEYSVKRLLRSDVIYGSQVPVNVEFIGVPTNIASEFVISQSGEGFNVTGFKYKDPVTKEKVKVSEIALGAVYGDTLSTGIYKFVVRPNPIFLGKWEKDLKVIRRTSGGSTAMFLASFNATQEDAKNKSDVLNLSINDASVQRGVDILNMMITIYNENWVEDKNKMAVSTTQFIDDRLASLEKELNIVDDNISEYKSSNLIPETNKVAEFALQEGRETAAMTRELENKLYIYRYLRTFLRDNPGTDKIIPLVASFSNHGVGEQIVEYNKMLLQRDNLQANSSDVNPVVVSMSQALVSMRSGIDYAVESQLSSLETQLSDLKKLENNTTDKIAQSPSQAKYLTAIGRQQKVKETLYLYLLQKREENELSQAFTAYNTRIITPPMAKRLPVSPKKMMILMIAAFLGLFSPLSVIYVLVLTDNKIRDKRDFEILSLPFLGEIPFESSKKRFVNPLKKQDKSARPEVLVKPGARSVINEAFRVFRTNLEFMERNVEHPVISLTSFNPGSGKTFISMNSAAAFAVKGKKVLVIDCDIRRSSLSEYVGLPKTGLTNYLSEEINNVDDVIIPVHGFKSLWMLPVGTIAPNPSELLSSSRFTQMIADLRAQYDLIVIDCPPVDLVADTQIINECVDRTIFVVRAGVLERKDVINLQKAYDSKRLKNLCYVFNGVERAASYYGHYGAYGHYGN